jgi:lipoprotein-anchoring transpeptidase ErfK/SrfK
VSSSTLQQKWTHRLRIGVLAGLLGLLLSGMPAAARATEDESSGGATSGGATNGPVAMSSNNKLGTDITASLPRPTFRPPLPFESPQVGPVIKRAFADDIEMRTTAFLPKDLSHLTPVKAPKNETRWIRVDLSEQVVVAYEGTRPIRAFVVSTGLARTPTVTGEFRIKTKVKAQTMSGGAGAYYYNLPNVKWVQYFHQEYAFHGTYWHNDFGRPKSHGCINMTNSDAKWLFDWAGPTWDGKTVWFNSNKDNPGTLVMVTE